jgi:hypothetical protein
MINNFSKKLYNTLKDENKSLIFSIKDIDNYKLFSSINRKLDFITVGGGIAKNSYTLIDNNVNAEKVELDNGDIFYYNVERYTPMNENNNYKVIDLVSLKKKNFDDESFIPCASIQLNLKNKKADIFSLGNNNKCIKAKNKDTVFKYGDIMFQIMLDICKRERIKYISLTDNSNITCGKHKLNLDVLKTLTHGTTHYTKYGFNFKQKIDRDTYNENKILFNRIPSIDKNELKKLIFKADIDEEITKYLFRVIDKFDNSKIAIRKVAILLTKDLENEEFCKLIYLIYYDLYKIAGYKPYYSKDYELFL